MFTNITLTLKVLYHVRLFCLLLLFLFSSSFYGRTQKDSAAVDEIDFSEAKERIQEKDTLYINELLNLAIAQRYYNLDSLHILASRALQLRKKINFKSGRSQAYSQLGIYYSDSGKHDIAIKNFEYAYQLAKDLGDSNLILASINDLAGEFAYRGDYAMALKEYLLGIELAEFHEDKPMLSVLNENIANLYISQKEYDQGMLFFKRVKKINKEIDDAYYMAETMSNMASAYVDMGKLDEAMFHINSSIRIFEREKTMDWLAYAYEIKGKIYLNEHKYDWAMYWYKQSELVHKGLDDDRSEIALLNGMAEASLGAKHDSISEVYALRALELSQKLKYKSGIRNGAKILYSVNKKKGNHKDALHFHELYQRLSDTLAKNENKKGLTLLKTKIEYDQQKEQLILENEKALARQKSYMYAFLFLIIIFLGITFLIRRNANIQMKLNKELLLKQIDLEKSEEHLKEVNQTKDKLFSIIGHDLRGPIGAFQGLIKLFKEGEMSKDEFLSFVPKLKSDIDNIAFTLNNLLSWGQTQMNGSVTTLGTTSLEHIVEENIGLLSEIASSKSIILINKVQPNTLTYSDSNQIDIVVRNLLSNAIKFTPKNGIVSIGALEKSRHWEVFVIDNGVGMNEETLGKIFKKDATHSTYGTNDEKGTGLGLSLCKEMVENNKGIIWVDSSVNKGSSFYFTIPKGKKNYRKSA